VNTLRNLLQAFFIALIRGYQTFISPALPRSCKYYPSCSQYAIDALRQYGVARGIVLAGWRLLRCNPLSYGGYDPVERQTLFAPRAGCPEVAQDPRKKTSTSALQCVVTGARIARINGTQRGVALHLGRARIAGDR